LAETKLKYWYDWEIFGPDGKLLVSLKSPPPPIDDKKLSNIDYLCKTIKEQRYATLMNENFAHRIETLQQLALTDKKAARDLKKAGKAISKTKRQGYIQRLKVMIRNDIEFFAEIYERKKNERVSVKAAIEEYLTRGTKDNSSARARRLREEDNYTTVYYAYKKVHTKLRSAQLTDPEIFCFFEKAGLHVDKPNPEIYVQPGNRSLTFVKRKTWYTEMKDMYVEVDGRAIKMS